MSALQLPFYAALERAIELVLVFDPDTRARLHAIDGKTIRLHIQSPNLTLTFSIVDGKVFCLTDSHSNVDTTLSGRLSSLLSLKENNDALYRRDVKIDGDLATGQTLKAIFSQLDPNWQDALAPLFGDQAVHHIDTNTEAILAWLTRTRSAFRDSMGDYLHEEIELIAPPAIVAQFCDDVDALKNLADRLDARLEQLESLSKDQTGEDAC